MGTHRWWNYFGLISILKCGISTRPLILLKEWIYWPSSQIFQTWFTLSRRNLWLPSFKQDLWFSNFMVWYITVHAYSSYTRQSSLSNRTCTIWGKCGIILWMQAEYFLANNVDSKDEFFYSHVLIFYLPRMVWYIFNIHKVGLGFFTMQEYER